MNKPYKTSVFYSRNLIVVKVFACPYSIALRLADYINDRYNVVEQVKNYLNSVDIYIKAKSVHNLSDLQHCIDQFQI